MVTLHELDLNIDALDSAAVNVARAMLRLHDFGTQCNCNQCDCARDIINSYDNE